MLQWSRCPPTLIILEGCRGAPPRQRPLKFASLSQQARVCQEYLLRARANKQQQDGRRTSEAKLTIRSRVNGLVSTLCGTWPDLLGLIGDGLEM